MPDLRRASYASAWQAATRFARKVVPFARFKTGMVATDWRDKRDGELPELHTITFRAKETQPVIL